MKVRLFEDSVRIRLSQREVMDLGARRTVQAATRFSNGELAVQVVPGDCEGLDVAFADGKISVQVNARKAAEWSFNELEGLYSLSGPCKVSLEKDYACLHKTGEANQGTFPNPQAFSK